MKKAILSILALMLAAMTLFSSCASAHIKDTNGKDDYSLQQLTEEDLLKSRSSVSSVSVSSTRDHETRVTVRKCSGVKEFRTFTKGTYTVTVNFKVNAGNIRLVLCDSDQILKEFEINSDGQSFTFDCGYKIVSLKAACESAGFELVYTVEKAQG